MKNSIVAGSIILFLVPQIALAAWWNPLSWFDSWSFIFGKKQDERVEVLENRIKDLESKLIEENNSRDTFAEDDMDIEEDSDLNTEQTEVSKESTKTNTISNTSLTGNVYSAPVLPKTIPQAEVVSDFDFSCSADDNNVDVGERVKFYINNLSGKNSDYEIEWDPTNRNGLNDGGQVAYYIFNKKGSHEVNVWAKRKSDGFKKQTSCSVYVREQEVKQSQKEYSGECLKALSIYESLENEYDIVYNKMQRDISDLYSETGLTKAQHDARSNEIKRQANSKLADISYEQLAVKSDINLICE